MDVVKINSQKSTTGGANNKAKLSFTERINKCNIINKMVKEYLKTDSNDKRAKILWGDGTDKYIRGNGLIEEFQSFLLMYADILKGVKPPSITNHAKQAIMFRNDVILKYPHLTRILEQMDKIEVFHDLILVFAEIISKFDPDRLHFEGKQKIHFVGFLQYNFKFYLQKYLLTLARGTNYNLLSDLKIDQEMGDPLNNDESSQSFSAEDLVPDEMIVSTDSFLESLEKIPKESPSFISDFLDVGSIVEDIGLTQIEAQLVSMKYIDKKSYEQISSILGISKPSVKKILVKSVEKIREFYYGSNDDSLTTTDDIIN